MCVYMCVNIHLFSCMWLKCNQFWEGNHIYTFIHYSFFFSPNFSFASPPPPPPHPKAGCPMHWSRSLPYPWIDWNFSTLLATVKLPTSPYAIQFAIPRIVLYMYSNRSSDIDETRWGGGGGGLTWFLCFSLASHFKTHSAFPIRGCSIGPWGILWVNTGQISWQAKKKYIYTGCS